MLTDTFRPQDPPLDGQNDQWPEWQDQRWGSQEDEGSRFGGMPLAWQDHEWHEWGYQSDDGWQDRQWHGWQWDYQQDQSQDQLLRPQHCFTRPWWSGDHLRPQYFRLAVFFYF